MVQRLLLRLAFDGALFHGSQRQPDRPTVDGSVLEALESASLLADDPLFRAAGRTDRGVSALDHPVALDATADLDTVARALTGRTKGILPWAGAEVPEGYDPRRDASARTYRYHWPLLEELDTEAAAEAWQLFEGTHDVRHFARLEAGRRPERTITRCDSWQEGDRLVFQVTGESFLWNQVRRMVGACLDVATGGITLADIEAALDGTRLPRQRLAPAEGLVLFQVALDVEPRPLTKVHRIARERVIEDHRRELMHQAAVETALGLGWSREKKRG